MQTVQYIGPTQQQQQPSLPPPSSFRYNGPPVPAMHQQQQQQPHQQQQHSWFVNNINAGGVGAIENAGGTSSVAITGFLPNTNTPIKGKQHSPYTNPTNYDSNKQQTSLLQNQQSLQQSSHSLNSSNPSLAVVTSSAAAATSLGQNYNSCQPITTLQQHQQQHIIMGPTNMNGTQQPAQLQQLQQQLQQQQQQHQPQQHLQQQLTAESQHQYHQQHQQTGSDQLSKTNVYIRGLPEGTTDKDLVILCSEYGTIVSAKAIFDKTTKKCKGYGFVDFESPAYADNAVKSLQAKGIKAQMAKVGVWVLLRPAIQQEQDPTNLYITNLPPYFKETDLEKMLSKYGHVVSTKILCDAQMNSRGVGFARMESREKCEQIIQVLNGTTIPGANDPLVVKFADSCSSAKKNLLKARDPNNRSRLDISGGTTGSYPLASSPWIPGYMMAAAATQPANAFENQYLQLASSPQHLSVSPYKPDLVNTLQAPGMYLNGSEAVMQYGAMMGPPMGPLQYISPTYPYYAPAPPMIPTMSLTDSNEQALSTAASPNGAAYTQFLHPLAPK